MDFVLTGGDFARRRARLRTIGQRRRLNMEDAHAHGVWGYHQFEKPTEVLGDEHRVIERVLAAVEKLLAAAPAPSLSHWKKVLDFISNFADQCHHLKEEKLLFPAMEAQGIPRDGGPIGGMLMEHGAGRDRRRGIFVESCAGLSPSFEGAYPERGRDFVQDRGRLHSCWGTSGAA